MHIPTGVRAVLAAVGTLAALGVIVGGYLFLHQGAGARQPVPVDLPGVPVAELASRGIALTAPPTDLRGTVSQDVAYQVAQDDWRTTEQKAARVDAVPITGSALAQVDIAGQPDGSCLCWVFVLGVEPPLQGPMQSFVDPSRTWFMSFVDARTGGWWGAKAVVHYLPEIEDMIKRGEAVPLPSAWMAGAATPSP